MEVEKMNEIKQQVKELRELADCYYGEIKHHVSTITKAADTIEDLYSKLQSMNCDGEWIYCADSFNRPTESGEYQTVFNGEEVFAKLNFDVTDGTWYNDYGQYQDVIAWWKVHSHEV